METEDLKKCLTLEMEILSKLEDIQQISEPHFNYFLMLIKKGRLNQAHAVLARESIGETMTSNSDIEYEALKVILEDEGRGHPLSELAERVGVKPAKIIAALASQIQKGALIANDAEDPEYLIDPEYAGLDDLRLAVAKNVDISYGADGSATFSVREAKSSSDEDEE